MAIKSVLVLALAAVAAAAPRQATTTEDVLPTTEAFETTTEAVSPSETVAASTEAVATSTEAATTEGAGECKTIAEIAAETPELANLLGAIVALGLDDRFNSLDGRNVTVFAPNNDAFNAISTENLTLPAIYELVSYHILPVAAPSSSLVDGQKLEPYVFGADLTVTVTDGGVQIDNANVVTADIEACNGVIHIIDTVLTPPERPGATTTDASASTEEAATSTEEAATSTEEAATTTEEAPTTTEEAATTTEEAIPTTTEEAATTTA